jgi:hypothetical protein
LTTVDLSSKVGNVSRTVDLIAGRRPSPATWRWPPRCGWSCRRPERVGCPRHDLTLLTESTSEREEVSGMEDCCDELQGCETGCC